MKQKTINLSAEYGVYIGALAVLYFISQQETIHEALLHFFTVGLLTLSVWIIGAILKYSFRKERPHTDKRFSFERDRYSFPSMHALTLSSAAFYVGVYSPYIAFFIFFIAVFVMYARVRTHMHFAIDMVAGFFLGLVLTFIITPYAEKYVSLFLG